MRKYIIAILTVMLVVGTVISIQNRTENVKTEPDVPAQTIPEDTDIADITEEGFDAEVNPDEEIFTAVENVNLSDIAGNWQSPDGEILSINDIGSWWIYRTDGTQLSGEAAEIRRETQGGTVITGFGMRCWDVYGQRMGPLPSEYDYGELLLGTTGDLCVIEYGEAEEQYVYRRIGDFEYLSTQVSRVPVLKGGRQYDGMKLVRADADLTGGYYYSYTTADGQTNIHNFAFESDPAKENHMQEESSYGIFYAHAITHWEIEATNLKHREDYSGKIGYPVYTFECTSGEYESTRCWKFLSFRIDGVVYIYCYDSSLSAADEMAKQWETDIAGLYLG